MNDCAINFVCSSESSWFKVNYLTLLKQYLCDEYLLLSVFVAVIGVVILHRTCISCNGQCVNRIYFANIIVSTRVWNHSCWYDFTDNDGIVITFSFRYDRFTWIKWFQNSEFISLDISCKTYGCLPVKNTGTYTRPVIRYDKEKWLRPAINSFDKWTCGEHEMPLRWKFNFWILFSIFF